MRKNYGSKLTWLFLGLVPLLLIACGGGGAAAPAADESAPPTAESVLEEPPVEAEAVEEVEADMDDEIVPVSGKPQLIEFYADW